MAEGLSDMCTVQKIHAITGDVCSYVNQYCTEEDLVRFSYFYFCKVSENVIILDILTVLVPLISFHLLSSTAENYLSPSLAKLAKVFRLSETVAGVTLLAFGNGAPDVITAIVAGGDDEGGISIAIGSIFGAGLFVTTATLAVVIKNAKQIKIEKRTFLRDVLFYLIGGVIILIFSIIKTVNIYMASAFMSIYLIFLIIVIYQDRLHKKELKEIGVDEYEYKNELEQEQQQASNNQSFVVNYYSESEIGTDINKRHYSHDEPLLDEKEEKRDQKFINTVYSESDQSEMINENYKKVQTAKSAIKMKYQFQSLKHTMKLKFYYMKGEFKEMTILQKIVFIYELPVDLIRDLTIPPADDEQWNKWRAILCCYTTPICFLFLIRSNATTISKHLYQLILSNNQQQNQLSFQQQQVNLKIQATELYQAQYFSLHYKNTP